MSEPKPFASLSSGLLARKGAAKPAMRPQGYGNFGSSLEDLGWDDMGYAAPQPTEHVPSSIAALTPAPGGRSHNEPAPVENFDEPEVESTEPPPIVEQMRVLEQSFEPEQPGQPEEVADQPEPETHYEPAPVVRLPRRVQPKKPAPVRAPAPAIGARGKAAFTLRLDADRHLRLRLACAVTRRSAQQIVTNALDEYLSSLPELDALAEHVPAGAGKRA
jgi:hypothetical protein